MYVSIALKQSKFCTFDDFVDSFDVPFNLASNSSFFGLGQSVHSLTE